MLDALHQLAFLVCLSIYHHTRRREVLGGGRLKSNSSLPKLRRSSPILRLCSDGFDESRLWNEIALRSRDTSSYVTE